VHCYEYIWKLANSILAKCLSTKLIGGDGWTAEIDESKFGKRKYYKGQLTEGQWVVGGMCRETGDILLALCPDTKETVTHLVSGKKRRTELECKQRTHHQQHD